MTITIWVCALLFWFGAPAEAAGPKSLVDLFNRVPEAPTTAEHAAQWFAADAGKPGPGKLIQGALLGLRADLAAGKSFSASLRHTAAKTLSEDPTKQGLNESGIDAARLQRDPAYQAELRQNMERMSAQEKMAFAQQLIPAQMQASLQDARAMGEEPSEVEAATEAATAYTIGYSAWMTGPVTAFTQEWEQVAQQRGRKPMTGKRPKIAWDSIGCEATCRRSGRRTSARSGHRPWRGKRKSFTPAGPCCNDTKRHSRHGCTPATNIWRPPNLAPPPAARRTVGRWRPTISNSSVRSTPMPLSWNRRRTAPPRFWLKAPPRSPAACSERTARGCEMVTGTPGEDSMSACEAILAGPGEATGPGHPPASALRALPLLPFTARFLSQLPRIAGILRALCEIFDKGDRDVLARFGCRAGSA